MNREIKFRCLNQEIETKRTEWVYYGIMSKPHCIGGSYITPDLQFTGLKDKNGKDIYEGDIVVFDIALNNPFEIKIENGAITNWSLFHFGHGSEVIGNKFENPELL